MSRTDEAVDWAARIDARPLDAPDQAALDGWLAANPRNQGALLRAQALLRLIGHPGEPSAAPAFAAPAVAVRKWWWMAGLTATAAALVAVITTMLLLPHRAHFVTETGEVRRVALDDGSRAIINTQTRMDAAITPRERLIVLGMGEAWFQVARDKARPFVVSAGPIRVRATGTAFAVRYAADRVTVTMTEGTVEVLNVDAPGKPVPVHAGQAMAIALQPDASAPPRILPASESALAWRDGDIVLDGMALGDAVAELNRYNLRKVRLDSPDIAATPMVGYFKNNQPEQFAHAAAGIIGGHVTTSGNEIVISTAQKRNKKISD